MRASKKKRYLDIAAEVAKGSTCLRRQYGSIIVREDEIIASGYNGAPRGEPNCCDVGSCWREDNNIPHGERYEACKAVHSEMNAIISAARRDMIGATLYLVGIENGKRIKAEPCEICSRLIKNAGIAEVITEDIVEENVDDTTIDNKDKVKICANCTYLYRHTRECGYFPNLIIKPICAIDGHMVHYNDTCECWV